MDAVCLLTENIAEEKICRRQPTSVNCNSVFLVDCSAMSHTKDILCDDMGVWTPSGVKTKYCRSSDKAYIAADKFGKVGTWKITRRTYKNTSTGRDDRLLKIILHMEGT